MGAEALNKGMNELGKDGWRARFINWIDGIHHGVLFERLLEDKT